MGIKSLVKFLNSKPELAPDSENLINSACEELENVLIKLRDDFANTFGETWKPIINYNTISYFKDYEKYNGVDHIYLSYFEELASGFCIHPATDGGWYCWDEKTNRIETHPGAEIPIDDIQNFLKEKSEEIDFPIDVILRNPPLYSKDESLIPEGWYCYIVSERETPNEELDWYICPYWQAIPYEKWDRHECGYCTFLELGDWMEKDFTMLLWDQCKECNLNMGREIG